MEIKLLSKPKYNFNPGPATLPQTVLQKVQNEFLNYQNTGISIVETSHRSKEFDNIINNAKQSLHKLLNIPANYEILFMQGGASSQFSAIPLNLCTEFKDATCDVLITGSWSEKAAKEFAKYINVNIAWSGKKNDYITIGDKEQWNLDKNASFLYYCSNETIHGVEFPYIPKGYNHIPLIGDFSSNFLTEPINISKFGIIFAGAQKNIGPAGVTIVIVKKNLLNQFNKFCPTMLNYTIMANKNSLYNTPPCFNIYVVNLVLEWIILEGGLEEMFDRKNIRANMFYNLIDESLLYYSPVNIKYRSNINIRLSIGKTKYSILSNKFIERSIENNFIGLKGHRSLGGLRISLYNSQTMHSCNVLYKFMREFHDENSPNFP